MTMIKSAGVKAAAEEDARGEAAADEGRKAEKDGRHERIEKNAEENVAK